VELKKQQAQVLKQLRTLREKMEDLDDYLDLLEARARNQGRPTYTTEQVKRIPGLA
jgi:cell division protein FtsB